MKILVVSDTHEQVRELSQILARHAGEVQLVCHLGDNAGDLLRFQSEFPQLDMVAVAGNCDYSPHLQNEIVLTLGEKRILLVHGHKHGVKQGNDRITYYAREKGVDAVFFGHGHWPVNEKRGGVLIFSPGSPCWPRGGSVASYGIVEIGDEIEGQILGVQ